MVFLTNCFTYKVSAGNVSTSFELYVALLNRRILN